MITFSYTEDYLTLNQQDFNDQRNYSSIKYLLKYRVLKL